MKMFNKQLKMFIKMRKTTDLFFFKIIHGKKGNKAHKRAYFKMHMPPIWKTEHIVKKAILIIPKINGTLTSTLNCSSNGNKMFDIHHSDLLKERFSFCKL